MVRDREVREPGRAGDWAHAMGMRHLVLPIVCWAEASAWGPGFDRSEGGFPRSQDGRVWADGAEEGQAGDAGGRIVLFVSRIDRAISTWKEGGEQDASRRWNRTGRNGSNERPGHGLLRWL